MRLINADELKDAIPEVSADIFENCGRCKLFDDVEIKHLIDVQPTVDAVPLEDYRSMEQTVYKLTQALAEAEPRWIPTTERLPDVGVYVLVCTKQKSGQIIERIGVYSGTSYGWSTGGATRDVVAWMPLPKIYKGDEVEDGGNK